MSQKRKKWNWLPDFTVIVIPKAEKETISLNVTGKKIMAAILGGTGTTLFILFSLFFIYGQQERMAELDRLKQANVEQEQLIAYLNNELEEKYIEQEDLIVKQEKIRSIIGISDLELNTAEKTYLGQGGGTGIEVSEAGARRGGALFDRLRNDVSRSLAWEKSRADVDELLAIVEANEAYYRGIPNQWPANGTISSEYGFRRSPFGGRSVSMHDGLDIANQVGTQIVAAADGVITYSSYMPVYGQTIMIDHGNGFVTKYGHCSKLQVDVGTKVKKGDPIALMGNTGRSTGPHVHFTVFVNGQTVDPIQYLP